MPSLVLNGTSLNDGSTYILQPGLDLGAVEPDYEVWTSYTGALTRGPVSRGVVEVTVPLLVRAASQQALAAAVEQLRSLVRACTWETPGTLVYADDGASPQTWSVVESPDPAVVRDALWYLGCAAQVTLTLRRLP